MSAALIPSYHVRSNGGSAAVDGELCTLDEARAIGREKDNCFGNLLGLGRTVTRTSRFGSD
jgi:hypothetical protein